MKLELERTPNAIILGIGDDNESMPYEVQAVEGVMGEKIDATVDTLVAEARGSCTEADCCLKAFCAATETHIDDYHEDISVDYSYDTPTTTIEVECEVENSCNERIEKLLGKIASVVQRCDFVSEKADKVAEKILASGNAKADKVMRVARETAIEIEAQAQAEAEEKRNSMYEEVRQKISVGRAEA